MTAAQVDKFFTIQQANLAMMIGIYQNLRILCEMNGSESAAYHF